MTLCFTRRKLLRVMLSAAGLIVGRIRRYYIMYETTIKFQLVDFIFDPEKSVVLFSHPTQPTHELGDLDKPRTDFYTRSLY